MKVSYVLIALLVAIVSLGAVCAVDNNTAVDDTTNNSGDDVAANVTTPEVDTNQSDVPAAGDNVTDAGNATNTTNTTNTTVANLTNDNSTATSMLETGLPVVALILVVLAAVGLYRRD